jgi:predicted transposase YbfD/YdcC
MDALHLCPETLESIALAGGTFLVGLKNNQKELLEDMEKATTYLRIENQEVTIDKGHGRLERREYYAYNIGGEYFDKRWDDCDFQTLIKIDRQRMDLKTRVESHETAYYMCNQKILDFNKNKLINISSELFQASRGHWAVETSNHIRDVSLKEDKLKTKKNEVSKVFSTLRTLVTNALKVEKYKNIKAQLENFSDNFDELLAWLRKISFL